MLTQDRSMRFCIAKQHTCLGAIKPEKPTCMGSCPETDSQTSTICNSTVECSLLRNSPPGNIPVAVHGLPRLPSWSSIFSSICSDRRRYVVILPPKMFRSRRPAFRRIGFQYVIARCFLRLGRTIIIKRTHARIGPDHIFALHRLDKIFAGRRTQDNQFRYQLIFTSAGLP